MPERVRKSTSSRSRPRRGTKPNPTQKQRAQSRGEYYFKGYMRGWHMVYDQWKD